MSDLGELFPQPPKLKTPTRKDLEGVKFSGNDGLLHLEVYHLIHKTKKLKKCTIKRMKRKQANINKRKAKLLVPKTPEEVSAKAERTQFLSKVKKIADIIKAEKDLARREYSERQMRKRMRGRYQRRYRPDQRRNYPVVPPPPVKPARTEVITRSTKNDTY